MTYVAETSWILCCIESSADGRVMPGNVCAMRQGMKGVFCCQRVPVKNLAVLFCLILLNSAEDAVSIIA